MSKCTRNTQHRVPRAQHRRSKLTNPLDLGDLFDLEVYAQIVERTLQLENVDGVIFLHTSLSDKENQTSRTLLEHIIEMVDRYHKPVAYYISAASQEVTYLDLEKRPLQRVMCSPLTAWKYWRGQTMVGLAAFFM